MSVADSLCLCRERIAAACRRVGRDPSEVRLVAVSKTQPAEAVREAIEAGADAIGENRVQEASEKRPFCPSSPPWHLIGPLQRNKAKPALEVFDLIETVDRFELADRLQSLLEGRSRVVPVFLEVNVGAEPQKSGVAPDQVRALAEHLLTSCPHLHLDGLMTVPPWTADPESSRPHFIALRAQAAALRRDLGVENLALSMGMSDDFEVAVEEGATEVRLGRIVFGERR
ncbi:MAG: YggS family pyridoxal phosphate-dependent enzyme [Acidobacteriota bacterium]